MDMRLSAALRCCGCAFVLFAVPVQAHDCTLSLSQSPLELGTLRPGLLSIAPGQSELSLGSRRMSLSIVCPRPVSMRLRFEAATAGPQAFRFDRQGRFTVGLSNALLDGKPVTLAVGHLPGEATASRLLAPNLDLRVLVQGLPAKGRFFSAQVEVDTYLPVSATQVRDETSVEGRGRFELLPDG